MAGPLPHDIAARHDAEPWYPEGPDPR